MQLLAPAAGA
jgi:hypothetical protein